MDQAALYKEPSFIDASLLNAGSSSSLCPCELQDDYAVRVDCLKKFLKLFWQRNHVFTPELKNELDKVTKFEDFNFVSGGWGVGGYSNNNKNKRLFTSTDIDDKSHATHDIANTIILLNLFDEFKTKHLSFVNLVRLPDTNYCAAVFKRL